MRTSLLLTFLAGCMVASAGTVCPGASTGTSFPHPPDPTATGCNAVITIAANGTVSTTVTDSTPYEFGEDVLIGVVNNSSTPVSMMSLNGNGAAIPIFGFDGDGVCTFTFPGSSYCNSSQIAGTDPQDYQGPTSTFSNIGGGGNTGTVNFSPAIAASGGSTYFSLEGVPSASISATVTGTGSTTTATAPTLGEWGMILLGVMLIGSAAVLMGRKATV